MSAIVRDGRLVRAPFLDIAARISAGGERGLLGLAFAPTFADRRPLLRRLHGPRRQHRGRRVPAPRDPAADRADPASERVLLRIDQPFANHNGGALAFGPGRDPLRSRPATAARAATRSATARTSDTLLGKLLRIDPRPARRRALRDPGRQPVRRPAGGEPAARSGPTACATRGASPSTGRPATSGSATSARDRLRGGRPLAGRLAGAARTSAGTRWRASACFDPPSGCDRTGLVLPVAEYGHDGAARSPAATSTAGPAVAGPRRARTSTPTTAAGHDLGPRRLGRPTRRRGVLLDSGLASPRSARTRPASSTSPTSPAVACSGSSRRSTSGPPVPAGRPEPRRYPIR